MRRFALVDAYNALFRLWREVPEDRDEARRLLLERAEAALRAGALPGVDRVHLVFDTLPGAERAGLRGRSGRLSWHYAAGSADDEILAHLRRHEGHAAGTAPLVVTDDRELAGRARQLGARTSSVRACFGPAPRRGSARERPAGPPGPAFTPADFGLPEGDIDLDEPPEDDLA